MNIFICFFLLFCLMIAALSDIYKGKIPNRLIKAGISVWFTAIIINSFLYDNTRAVFTGLAAAFTLSAPLYIVSLIFKLLTKKKAFGGGDIKLLFMTGLYLETRCAVKVLLLSLIISSLYGTLLKLYAVLKQKKHTCFNYPVPFAPAVFLAVLISIPDKIIV